MIKRIFWDIDETLIHTLLRKEDQEAKYFVLPDDPNDYYVIIRPCSKDLIEYSNKLVGKDNVYILTTSTKDYANTINQLASWGFESDHILTREVIKKYTHKSAWNGEQTIEHPLADKNNVLIDNLPFNYNTNKVFLIGIDQSRYLQIEDYYGVNHIDDSFEEDVKNFLEEKNK